jgi:hypothetical protein
MRKLWLKHSALQQLWVVIFSRFVSRISSDTTCWINSTGFPNMFKLFQDLLLSNKINNSAANLPSIFHAFCHLTFNHNQRNWCRNLSLETWLELLNFWIELIWWSSPSKEFVDPLFFLSTYEKSGEYLILNETGYCGV